MNLVTWVPTPLSIVKKMLDMAQVDSKDIVYDLGSGDARVLIMAVRDFGVKKAVGYEIRQDLCELAMHEIRRLKLEKNIKIIHGNLLEADISQASIITIYLRGKANQLLRSRLEQYAKPNTCVISYRFPIKGWRAIKRDSLKDCSFADEYYNGMIYLYSVPQSFQYRRHG